MANDGLESKIDGLIRKMKSKKLSDRRGASFSLIKIEPEALPFLEKAFKKERYDIKVELIKCMGEMTGLNVGPILIQALDGNHHEIRKAAAVALSKIKDSTAVPALCRVLADEHAEVRKEAMWALFKLKDKEAVLPLTQKLYDDDKYVRVRAATILGEFGDERAVGPLIDALKDEPEVCIEAMRSLSKIGDKKAWESIETLENHPDARVRQVLHEVRAQAPAFKSSASLDCMAS
jgi:HEAT repeat protein